MTDNNNVLERLAAIEHERWSGWEKYRERCVAEVRRPGDTETHEERWRRLRETPYDQLTEKEKESDRVEARKSLAVMQSEIERLKTLDANTEQEVDALAHDLAWYRGNYAGLEKKQASLLEILRQASAMLRESQLPELAAILDKRVQHVLDQRVKT